MHDVLSVSVGIEALNSLVTICTCAIIILTNATSINNNVDLCFTCNNYVCTLLFSFLEAILDNYYCRIKYNSCQKYMQWSRLNAYTLISGSPFLFLSLLASLNTVSIQDLRCLGMYNRVSSEQWVVRCLASVFIPSSVIRPYQCREVCQQL